MPGDQDVVRDVAVDREPEILQHHATERPEGETSRAKLDRLSLSYSGSEIESILVGRNSHELDDRRRTVGSERFERRTQFRGVLDARGSGGRAAACDSLTKTECTVIHSLPPHGDDYLRLTFLPQKFRIALCDARAPYNPPRRCRCSSASTHSPSAQ